MDDEAEAMLVELGRRAREREDARAVEEVPPLDAARRRAMLVAVGVDPTDEASSVPVDDAQPTRPTPRRRIIAAAVLASVAAAAAAIVVSTRPPAPALTVRYDLELAGGRAAQLAAPRADAARRYRPEDPLVVRMRPHVADPGVRVLSLRARPEAGGTAILAPALARVDDGGALEVSAPLGELLPLVAGRWHLDVGVGLPGACEQDSEDRCTWVSTTIEIVDER